MADLLSLQKDFLEGLRGGGAFQDSIKIKGASPHARLSVYQNNMSQALRKVLRIMYPLAWKLIGEECANGAAYAFIQEEKSLPHTGVLDEWGDAFPDFLEHFPPTQSLPYLPDFARLEWLKHVAYCAEDKVPLKGTVFKEINPERYADLVLTLHPSAQLFSSAFALDQVMDVVTGEIDSTTLEGRGATALIIRPDKAVHVYWISKPYFDFFSDLKKGVPLLEALEKSDEITLEFHKVFSFSLEIGLFSAYSLTHCVT